MKHTDVLTRALAIAGTALVILPVLAPIAFSGILLATRAVFHFDYLMPAELFPLALAGGGLLLWAALRARARRAWVGGGLAAAVALLFAGQGLAVLTGLASGEIEPAGWPMAVVLSALVLYALALVLIAVGGALLLSDLFRHSPASL